MRYDCAAQELAHVVAEIRTAHPQATIETSFDVTHAVECDRRRIAELLGNRVSNAITHGSPSKPVRVVAKTDSGIFELSVRNFGPAISADKQAQLFLPFNRGDGSSSEGLGLGLYICAEIAKAQGGALFVESTVGGETVFYFRMPVQRKN